MKVLDLTRVDAFLQGFVGGFAHGRQASGSTTYSYVAVMSKKDGRLTAEGEPQMKQIQAIENNMGH